MQFDSQEQKDFILACVRKFPPGTLEQAEALLIHMVPSIHEGEVKPPKPVKHKDKGKK